MLNFCSFGFQSLEYDPIFYQGLVEIVSFAFHRSFCLCSCLVRLVSKHLDAILRSIGSLLVALIFNHWEVILSSIYAHCKFLRSSFGFQSLRSYPRFYPCFFVCSFHFSSLACYPRLYLR